MEYDEESSNRSVGVQASYGNPQYIKDGATIYGLDVHAKKLPSLKTLLGKYAWVETGVEQPCGPQLEEGLTLRLENPDAPVEFPNLRGEFLLMEEVGMFVGVRRGGESDEEDCTPCWEFDIEWKKSNKYGQLLKARMYVGTVLDDNGAPFLEIMFGDETDLCIPYGYAKRQSAEGDAIGLSEDEKKRLNFLTNVEYDALMEAKEAKERKPIEAKIRKRIWEKEEQKRLEREKQERRSEIQRKKEEQRMAQLIANAANGILNEKELKRLEQEERAIKNRLERQRKAANKEKREEDALKDIAMQLEEASKVASRKSQTDQAPEVARRDQAKGATTKKQRKEEMERLAREEAKYDLLNNLPHMASTSSIGCQAPTQQTPTVLPIQRWPGVKQEPADLKGFPKRIVKQDEIPPALHREDHHGIKRSHPDDPEDKAFKRLKLEY